MSSRSLAGMTAFSQIAEVARAKALDLAGRSSVEAWAGLASIWVRLFVVADAAWSKWPAALSTTIAAMTLALRAAAGDPPPQRDRRDLADALEGLGVEDDGSADWQRMIDLAAMLQDALRGSSVESCLENAIRWYLEGEFNMISNGFASVRGKPISQEQAEPLVEADTRWIRACSFVQAL